MPVIRNNIVSLLSNKIIIISLLISTHFLAFSQEKKRVEILEAEIWEAVKENPNAQRLVGNQVRIKHDDILIWCDTAYTYTGSNKVDALGNVLAVNDEYLERNISIFPNPTSGFIQIKIKEWVNDMRYEVYNVLGQTLKSNELQNNEILDLTDLPNDIYFIKIAELDSKRILVKKIVLNR